jgi:LPXTG-site transpeptidase (sortase) family protein
MLKKNLLKLIFSFLVIIFIILTITTIYNIKQNNNNLELSIIVKNINNKETPIGKLIIKNINLKQNLYSINSEENTIEKNVEILKESIYPDKDNSLMILAAHSGTGEIAYFEELDKLNINDEIILIYKNKKYTYIIKEIWEEKKNGYININKENKKQLILTTCSPNKYNYQLIINCIEKES